MTATEIFDSVMNGGSNDFALLAQILNQHGSWCLIGGLAVNCYVEPVFTVDADIVVISTQLDLISEDLGASGFSLEAFPHLLNAKRPGSELRIQITLDPRYQSFLEEAMPKEVLGQTVPVASLADVVRGKIWAWSDEKRRATKRKKDELDLMRIAESYPELRAQMPTTITDQLET
jgi:hypothetical protein